MIWDVMRSTDDLDRDEVGAMSFLDWSTEEPRRNWQLDWLGLVTVRGRMVSAHGRVEALVRRLGFRFVGTHPGSAWMRTRGWTYAEWDLATDEWWSRRTGRDDRRASREPER